MIEIITIIQDIGSIVIWPISLILLILILLQGGAGDISSAFGGGGQLDSSLGVGAQQKISKVTGWFVAAFLVIVIIMSIPITGTLSETAAADVVVEDATLNEDALAGEAVVSDTPTEVEEATEAGDEGTDDAATVETESSSEPTQADAADTVDTTDASTVEAEPVDEPEASSAGEVEVEVVE